MKSDNMNIQIDITPEVLLKAYSCGIFPMAEAADDDELFWIEPKHRGIIPFEHFHVPKSLAKIIRKQVFEVRIDTDFQGVLDGCAAPRPDRPSTWINSRIRELYTDLFEMGHCHTVEVYKDDVLVGGLYGVELNAAFFGESMFSYVSNASKVALVYLVARLKYGGFTLLDTQFVTDHLETFGAIEVTRDQFQRRLERTRVRRRCNFSGLDTATPPTGILQLVSQTS